MTHNLEQKIAELEATLASYEKRFARLEKGNAAIEFERQIAKRKAAKDRYRAMLQRDAAAELAKLNQHELHECSEIWTMPVLIDVLLTMQPADQDALIAKSKIPTLDLEIAIREGRLVPHVKVRTRDTAWSRGTMIVDRDAAFALWNVGGTIHTSGNRFVFSPPGFSRNDFVIIPRYRHDAFMAHDGAYADSVAAGVLIVEACNLDENTIQARMGNLWIKRDGKVSNPGHTISNDLGKQFTPSPTVVAAAKAEEDRWAQVAAMAASKGVSKPKDNRNISQLLGTLPESDS